MTINDMSVSLGVDTVINAAQVTVYPVETVGAVMTLWKARTVLHVAPGSTRVVIAPFRDENGERVGAVDVIAPAAAADYRVNDAADGSGFDYTNSPSLTISAEIEATRAKITLVNTATGTLYVTLLQIRGRPIRVWDPVTVEQADSASQAAYEVRAAALDLPMQSDPVFAQSYADYLVTRFKTPFVRADGVVIRGCDRVGNVNVFSLDLMDKIIVNDPASAGAMLQHWIRGVDYDLTATTFTVTLWLERADNRQYWLLGRAGYGQLGLTARLGF